MANDTLPVNLRAELEEADLALDQALKAIDALATAGVARAGRLALELRGFLGAHASGTEVHFDIIQALEDEIDRIELADEREAERDARADADAASAFVGTEMAALAYRTLGGR